MTTPYTITILQLQGSVLIVDIQQLQTTSSIKASASIGFQIIVEGYWVLKYDHLNAKPPYTSIQKLLKASPYHRQLDYWRQLLCGKEEVLSLRESQRLAALNEVELQTLLRTRRVHAYSRQDELFLLYRNPQLRDFQRLAPIFILNAQQLNDTQYQFEVYESQLLAHLTQGLSWGTGSFA